MTETDTIENWLNTVAFSHSNSNNTRMQYTYHIKKFLNHIGKTAHEILEEYEISDDKQFKQKYTPLIMSLIGKMRNANYSLSTQQLTIATIKSFFKYNSLPLGFIPTGKQYVRFHNRPITRQEIKLITEEARPREKAYYALMTQSGLRPQTISNLKIGDFENLRAHTHALLLEENTPIPCPIIIRQEITKGKYSEYWTFTDEESIRYIKEYLKRQRKQPLTPEEYLFTMENGKTPVQPDVINHTFARTIKNLRKENSLDFKADSVTINKKTRTNNKLKLYSLRKYHRNNNRADWDYKNFWMGHIAKLGVDKSYIDTSITPENIEKHRQIYKEKAAPYLKIETTSADEILQTATKLETEYKQLKKQLTKIEEIIIPKQHEYEEPPPEFYEQMDKEIEEHEKEMKIQEKYYKKYPEKLKQQKEQQEKRNKEYDKYLKEHPEIVKQMEQMQEQDEKLHTELLETENKELRERLTRIEKLLKITPQTEETENGETKK